MAVAQLLLTSPSHSSGEALFNEANARWIPTCTTGRLSSTATFFDRHAPFILASTFRCLYDLGSGFGLNVVAGGGSLWHAARESVNPPLDTEKTRVSAYCQLDPRIFLLPGEHIIQEARPVGLRGPKQRLRRNGTCVSQDSSHIRTLKALYTIKT